MDLKVEFASQNALLPFPEKKKENVDRLEQSKIYLKNDKD